VGQVRRASATTIFAVRVALQRSQASLTQLSVALGTTPKTMAKWQKRAAVEDLKTGPKEPRSTVLIEAEDAAVVAFRCHTLLPLGRVDKRNSQSAIVMIQCWKLGASHDPRPDRHRSLGADRPVPAA